MKRSTWLTLAMSVIGAIPAVGQEPASNPNPLTVDGGLVLWTLFVFALLFLVLRKAAWPQLLGAVRDRERRLEQQIAEAEKARAEAKQLLEQHRVLLAGGKQEAQEILTKARAGAEKDREALLIRARQEYDDMLNRARGEIRSEQQRAREQLRRDAVDLSIAAASRLIDAKLDGEANRRLVTEYLESLSQGSTR